MKTPGVSEHKALAFAAKLATGGHSSGYFFLDLWLCKNAPLHHGHGGQLQQPGVKIDLVPAQPFVALPDAEDVEVVFQALVFDAVDGVEIFTEDLQISQRMLVAVPKLPHLHGPRAGGRGGVRAGKDAVGFEAGVFAVQFLGHDQFVWQNARPVRGDAVVGTGAR